MKRLILSVKALLLLSGLAALVTWKVVGPPDRSVPCDPVSLEKGEVCLSTVREWSDSAALWVDARPRDKWKEDGVDGSVLVNDQEDWDDMTAEFANAVFNDGQQFEKVIVYCNKAGCGSSKTVANRLREELAEDFGFEVFVLHGGVKALRAESK